jgi:hypothetical protein
MNLFANESELAHSEFSCGAETNHFLKGLGNYHLKKKGSEEIRK